MVELAATTPVFSISLGLNLLVAIPISRHLENRELSYRWLKNEMERYGIEPTAPKKFLKQAAYRSFPFYKNLNDRLFWASCILSVWAFATSFYFLLRAALAPAETISSLLFISLATVFLILNPALFALYQFFSSERAKARFKERAAASNDEIRRLEIMQFLLLAEIIQINQETGHEIAKAELEDMLDKIEEFASSARGFFTQDVSPIRWLRNRRVKKMLKEIERERNSKSKT